MVQSVTIEGSQSNMGTVAGGAAGGAVGSTVGPGAGRTLSTVFGAIAGGLAGRVIEEQATRKTGLEITVRLDNDKTVAIVQEADEEFQPGDRVRILTGPDGAARVRH